MKIVNMGFAVPETVESADDVAAKIGKSADWVRSRTGVNVRHVAEKGFDVCELAAAAAKDAIGDGPPPDLIINASVSRRQYLPDNAIFIQRYLGYEGIPSFSVTAACMSFLVGLNTAQSLLQSGAYKRILLVSAELGTVGRNYKEAESAALFGDGAAAALLECDDGSSGVHYFKMNSYPAGIEYSEIRGGGLHCHPDDPATKPEDNLFKMNGKGIMRFSFKLVLSALKEFNKRTGLEMSDVDLIVPHQTSRAGMKLFKRLGAPPEKTVNILAEYGNCVSASSAMALAQAYKSGRIHSGDKVLMVSTAAGISIGVLLLEW